MAAEIRYLLDSRCNLIVRTARPEISQPVTRLNPETNFDPASRRVRDRQTPSSGAKQLRAW